MNQALVFECLATRYLLNTSLRIGIAIDNNLIFGVGNWGFVGWGFVGRGGGVSGGFVGRGGGVSWGFVGRGGGVSGGFVGWSGGGVSGSFVFRSLVGWGSVGWGSVCGSLVFRSLVGWGGVGSSLVLGLDVFGVLGLSFVFHISGVSVSVSLVGDDLGAAIGESDAVRSGDDVVVGFLVVLEVVVRFLILDVVSEAVGLRGLVIKV
jgi:hypothetical protein